MLGLVVLGFATRLPAQQKTGSPNSTNQWEVLHKCLLLTNAAVDGDSFHVISAGREYVFRLYFVDAPESDATQRERIEDQAAYFGVPSEDIPRVGKMAAGFSRERLSGREFTVITRWRNAQGRSALARFYGVVLVDGKNLAEELVSQGLARIHGIRANWPDGPRSTTFISQLKNREMSAREAKRGIWNDQQFPRIKPRADLPDSGTNTAPHTVATAVSKLDLNSASFEDLQTLPGIGPKLAERVMAHRPFKTLEDLDRVPGIGAKMIERLRPLVTVQQPTR